ncbi:MAG: NADH-quinone oxidoreductase subunit NuoK [Nitrospira sp.]|jgi:NADH-quinone oxidoreductase subunit K|nr:NADH-quinone oxidoreductase subunit NuoK [Nitrospira sp.]MDH4246148.1 NADH-quinone oxidoreductase subunit NuoK [Nitrospira sp.]MDH4357006.1 NADH-quinone oxidoreductase subunit NuoK [Nitrospira sp.]MDH5319392.1 NADH-quinone oxidoreductase subunit NuoK [Nitrospira sp.]NGZ96920.1 NADH-quinone oxidoreductase subunit NuoK [Nitrospira sp. WS110]
MLSTPALVLAIVLFGLGLIGLLSRRNILYMLLSLEIMLNAAALAFIAGGARWGQVDGEIMFLFILTLAAAEVSVALGIVLQLSHRFRTVDADALCELRG